VEQEFLADFRGTDFLHGYSYRQVVPFIDLDLTALPSSASMLSCSHVRKLTPSDVFKIEIALTFDVNL
jgi:hypothetical protein